MKKYLIFSFAALMGAMTFTACGDDDNKNGGKEDGGDNTEFNIVTTSPIVDKDSYI